MATGSQDSDGFAGSLAVKSTPTTSDIVKIADAAASSAPKQATVGSLPFVQLAGSTMTGALILSGDPVAALGAVTKQYADAISAGLDVKTPVYAASTGTNLTVTYSNGVAGVGATITNAGSQATFALDSVTPAVGQRVLIKDQTSAFQNGIYSVTNAGSAITNYVLTRTTDYDLAPSEIFPGNLVIVTAGTINASTSWLQTATVNTIGTDSISFIQFTTTPLTLPLSLAQGGTNHALTASNGGIVYSDGSKLDILSGTATANQIPLSGSSSAPTWSTATYPATTTVNQLLYSSSANTIAGLATSNSGLLVTSAGGVPSISTAIPNGVTATTQSSADNSTKLATTAYVTTAVGGAGTVTNVTASAPLASSGGATPNITVNSNIPLNLGGTNANLTANNGGIFYSTASAAAILAGTATANQLLLSGASTTPAWSTVTHPATTTINQLLYSSSANVLAGLATANSGILVTSAGGVPSIGTAIPNGVTATTQSANDNSTKVATTAYVNSAMTGGGLTWTIEATSSVAMAINNGYIVNNSSSLCTLTLPSTAAIGSVCAVVGLTASTGLWKVAQNASQQINMGSQASTSGTGGSLASALVNDIVFLMCTVANTQWTVLYTNANLTVT